MPSVKYSSYATEVYCVLTFHITLILTNGFLCICVGGMQYMLIAALLHLALGLLPLDYYHGISTFIFVCGPCSELKAYLGMR